MATEFHLLNSSDITFKTTLDNSKSYLVKIRWNDSTSSWYLGIDSVEEYTNFLGETTNEIQGYERVVINQPLVRTNTEMLTNGNFYVLPSIREKDEELGRYNLGSNKSYRLYYVLHSEL